MKRRWIRRILFAVVATAAAPFLLWGLIVLVAPTGWAKARVVSALERSSGRSVSLERLSVRLAGGIDLVNLRIGAPGALADPWLEARKVHVDEGLFQMLFGGLDATVLDVDGALLRVLRRSDGSLELQDLVKAETPAPVPTSVDDSKGSAPVIIRVQNSEVLVVDEPTGSRFTLEEVEGEATWIEGRTIAGVFNGTVNQGPFQLSATFNRNPANPSFEGQLQADRVVLDDGMAVLRYLVPVLAGQTPRIRGDFNMELYLRGEGDTKGMLAKTLTGNGKIIIDPIELDGTELLAEIEKRVQLKTKTKFASLNSDLIVQDGRVITNRLALHLAKAPLIISGWTDFDGQLDYRMGLEGLVDRVPSRARRVLAELDLDVESLTTLRLSGTVDHLEVSLMGRAAEGASNLERLLDGQDPDRLKNLGREFRDRLFR